MSAKTSFFLSTCRYQRTDGPPFCSPDSTNTAYELYAAYRGKLMRERGVSREKMKRLIVSRR